MVEIYTHDIYYRTYRNNSQNPDFLFKVINEFSLPRIVLRKSYILDFWISLIVLTLSYKRCLRRATPMYQTKFNQTTIGLLFDF